MMLHKIMVSKLCRMCGQEKQQGTELFKDKVKGSMLISIIDKHFAKDVINISVTDVFSKYICIECEHKLCLFDEFYSMVANIQKQLIPPSLDMNFTEDVLYRLKGSDALHKIPDNPINIQEKRKYSCLMCGKNFRCQAHLNRHKRIHTGQRPFVCDICQMSFNQQEILTKHKECHEGKKQFQCAHCHQYFRHKVSLKSHMISFHTDLEQAVIDNRIVCLQDQSLSCSECGKLFATRYKLQRHVRCHTGERPYQCTYCDRSFSQSGNLKIHQVKCHQIMCPIPSETQEPLQQQHPIQEVEGDVSGSLNNFQNMYIMESDIQNTLNETINSTDPSTSYLNKSYESSIYIDDEIETMLDHDLDELERHKYTSSQEKVSLCLKQPETPELLHSLLYDD